ncbi:hypothetical protein PspS49_19405 [Pseudomonas sp. S49]|nr:hypothetical protein PspS49_19405 [Pseudomonas sp. S49]
MGRPCSWGFGGISVAVGVAAGGSALTAGHFGKRPKVTKGLCPDVRPARWGSGFLRSGIDPGASPTVCFAAPPLDVFDFVERSLRSHPGSIPPLSLPTGLQIKIKSCSRANAHPVEWGGFAAWAAHELNLWERAGSRWRPDSRPIFCLLYSIQLWEQACSRRRPSSRPVFCLMYSVPL